MTERELYIAKGFNYAIFVPGAIQSSSLCTPGHPPNLNITPLTKDHQVWSSISKHMTPNYYSSPQSILGDLTNNMSFSVDR